MIKKQTTSLYGNGKYASQSFRYCSWNTVASSSVRRNFELCTVYPSTTRRRKSAAGSSGSETSADGDDDEADDYDGDADSITSKSQQRFDRAWQEKFQKLQAFVESLGENLVDNTGHRSPPPYPGDVALISWINRNRHNYQLKLMGRPHVLTDARQTQLEELGYPLVPRDEYWERQVAELEQFFARHHGKFPYDFAEHELTDQNDLRLLWWCRRQRRQYKVWNNEANIDDDDSDKDDDGKDDDDGEENGENQSASSSSMTRERFEKLSAMGFCWDKHEAIWMARYRELKNYYEIHGNCLVPAEYAPNPSLAKWVADQRHIRANQIRRSKKTKVIVGNTTTMSPRRVTLLEELGFEVDALQARWMLKYAEYRDHVKRQGVARLPTQSENSSLRAWLNYQRTSYSAYVKGEKSSMTPFRKRKLDELGFSTLMNVPQNPK